jgi:hypothetical protein
VQEALLQLDDVDIPASSVQSVQSVAHVVKEEVKTAATQDQTVVKEEAVQTVVKEEVETAAKQDQTVVKEEEVQTVVKEEIETATKHDVVKEEVQTVVKEEVKTAVEQDQTRSASSVQNLDIVVNDQAQGLAASVADVQMCAAVAAAHRAQQSQLIEETGAGRRHYFQCGAGTALSNKNIITETMGVSCRGRSMCVSRPIFQFAY